MMNSARSNSHSQNYQRFYTVWLQRYMDQKIVTSVQFLSTKKSITAKLRTKICTLSRKNRAVLCQFLFKLTSARIKHVARGGGRQVSIQQFTDKQRVPAMIPSRTLALPSRTSNSSGKISCDFLLKYDILYITTDVDLLLKCF